MQDPGMVELIDEHGRMVYGIAYRILGNKEDAEDVYQEVFLKASKLLGSRRRAKAVQEWGAFLRVMATRRSIDTARRNKTRGQAVGVSWIEDLEGPDGSNPRRTAILREQGCLIRQAVAALPKRESLAFCLRHFDGLSYEETAAHLGASVSAVGVLLHRARHRLRTALEPVLAQELCPAPSTSQPVNCTVKG